MTNNGAICNNSVPNKITSHCYFGAVYYIYGNCLNHQLWIFVISKMATVNTLFNFCSFI